MHEQKISYIFPEQTLSRMSGTVPPHPQYDAAYHEGIDLVAAYRALIGSFVRSPYRVNEEIAPSSRKRTAGR